MTRALPSQPSPQFLTNEMLSGEVQPDPTYASYSPATQTPTRGSISKDSIIAKLRRRSRPSYSKMIEDAVFENCQRRKGTSLAIIKKHLQQKYGVDVKKSAKRICKCIRESVSKGGQLKQMTGSGANGSFKLLPNVRKNLEAAKEKHLIFKIGSAKLSVPKKASKIKVQKVSKADTPVTRMRVKER